jgi:hypothetical protein
MPGERDTGVHVGRAPHFVHANRNAIGSLMESLKKEIIFVRSISTPEMFNTLHSNNGNRYYIYKLLIMQVTENHHTKTAFNNFDVSKHTVHYYYISMKQDDTFSIYNL